MEESQQRQTSAQGLQRPDTPTPGAQATAAGEERALAITTGGSEGAAALGAGDPRIAVAGGERAPATTIRGRESAPAPGARAPFTVVAGGERAPATTVRGTESSPAPGAAGALTVVAGGERVPAMTARGRESAPTPDAGPPFATIAGEEPAPATSESAPTAPVPTGEEAEDSDRLSALPDDLLLLIVGRLPVGEAVRTSVLSRRWRTIWSHRSTLVITEDTAPPGRFGDFVDGALAGHDGSDLNVLLIHARIGRGITAAKISSWLRAAAVRVTGEFVFSLAPAKLFGEDGERLMELEFPRFQKASSIVLSMVYPEIRLPEQTFSALTRLILAGIRFSRAGLDPGLFVSTCCSELQTLEMDQIWGTPVLNIISSQLVQLRLSRIDELRELVINAPNLQRLEVLDCLAPESEEKPALIDVPRLKMMGWHTSYPYEVEIRHRSRRLDKFSLSLEHIDFTAEILCEFHFIGSIELVTKEDETTTAKELGAFKLPKHGELCQVPGVPGNLGAV